MRGTSVMCAPERIEMPRASRVLLHDRLDDLLRGLVEAGIDDFHAGIAKSRGNDPWLRDHGHRVRASQ